MVIGTDIETYSSVDLTASGMRPYTEAPDFEVMLIAYQIDDQPVKLIDLAAGILFDGMDDIPVGSVPEFEALVKSWEDVKNAHNAAFERTCLAKHFNHPMPPEQWRCTMVHATMLGLPASLGEVGAALGLDKQKMTEGKELINYFCKPCKPTKANGERTRNLPEHAPEKWRKFRQYCVRDVEAEAEIRKCLERFPVPADEQQAWELDQRMNDRGIRLDPMLVEKALELDGQSTGKLMEEAIALTGLENPNSGTQLTAWLESRGLEVPSLDKKVVPELMKQAPDAKTHRVLEIRRELAKTSVKKYEAMQRGVCADGRVHNLLQFYGAGRTGRWAGRLVQVQNLPQNKLPDIATARDLVMRGEFDLLELAFGAPSFVLSQLIRTAFIPSEGRRFVVADYSAIEARVLAWLAGEEWVLDVFRGDGLIYEATASMMFHVPKDDIKKGGSRAELRSKGKVATLACGYQGSVGALVQMGAIESGIPEKELPAIVKRWRNANKRIVRYWYDVEAAAIEAVEGGRASLRHGVKFFCEGGYLFIQLPSGRRLAYYKPRLEHEPKFDKMGITYMGVNDKKQYTRLRTYGGKLVENITQAVARDCLRDSMAALEAAGHDIVMSVHDEVVIDDPAGGGALEGVLEIMGRPMPWAPGLPLSAAGFDCDFYMKD